MAIFRPDPVQFITGALTRGTLPKAITPRGEGGKFTPEGAPLPFPGNTILCHVDPSSDAHAALCELQDEVRSSAFGGVFTFLPTDSLHMTVFQGISPDETSWPEGVAAGAERDAVTAEFQDRLAGQMLPQSQRVSVRGLFAGHSVTIEGADAASDARLRATRVSLRHLTGLRHAHFDSYTFHITLGYPLRWLPADEAQALTDMSEALFDRYKARLQNISLGRLELCNFETMHHFEPVTLL